MKIIISSDYEFLRPSILRITNPFFFASHGEVIHDGRNQIKLFTCDGVTLVVKSYGHLTLFNRLIFGVLRKSKAERAYLYAKRLRDRGIDTPREVAFSEIRWHGLLQKSYFISLYSDYLPLKPVTDAFSQSPEKNPILDALAEFLARIHRAGIMHNDLNITNILYKSDATAETGYRFQVIDTNRLSFHGTLTNSMRLHDLRRLSCKVPAYIYLLDRYAVMTQADPEATQLRGVLARLLFEFRQRCKYTLKKLF